MWYYVSKYGHLLAPERAGNIKKIAERKKNKRHTHTQYDIKVNNPHTQLTGSRYFYFLPLSPHYRYNTVIYIKLWLTPSFWNHCAQVKPWHTESFIATKIKGNIFSEIKWMKIISASVYVYLYLCTALYIYKKL